MSMRAGASVGTLCPNCQERIPDTRVSYEEALFSEMRASSVNRMRQTRSQRRLATYGTATLCSSCAAAYERCVRLRVVGRRLMNVGVIVMLAFAILYGLFLSGSAQQGSAGLVVAVVIGIGALVLAAGAITYFSGRILRRSAARFVGKLQK